MTKTIYRKPGKIEITKGWDFNYKVSQYHGEYTLILSLIYFTFYISLPEISDYDFNNWDRSWGVYWYGNSINFHWGNKHMSWRMPWDWEHVRHEVLFPSGQFLKPPKDSWDTEDGRLIEVHPYTYVLKNGTIQKRLATVYAEEREWRWRWFTWLPYPRMIRRSINISFNGEVGEGTGSWKGGTVGCGWDILQGESMLDGLRRMEKERKFS